MTKKLSLRDLPLKGKTVVMRVDFNVPVDAKGNISDDARLRSTLPSIKYVLDQGGALVLLSHMGRPKGKPQAGLSLAPCAKRLGQLLDRPVTFLPEAIGPQVLQTAKSLKPGDVLVLENLRFYPAEENPERDPRFAQELARLGDYYVNEAFSSAHRAHSSTAVITSFFPGRSAAGFYLEKEMEFLGRHLSDPERPFFAIVGGNKASTKLGVLKSLVKKSDGLFLGGAMAFTFLKAQGAEVGNSLYEPDLVPKAKEILSKAEQLGTKIWLPIDVVVVPEVNELLPADRVVRIKDGIPHGLMGVDIGPETIATYKRELSKAKTVFWNGPMGVFEISQFAAGTEAMAELLAQLPATTIVGGGDSLAALQRSQAAERITHLSTGGGASLEYIELGTLPGIEALSDAPAGAASSVSSR